MDIKQLTALATAFLLIAGITLPLATASYHTSVDQEANANTEQEAAAEAQGGNASVEQEANTNIEQDAEVNTQDNVPQEQEQAQEVETTGDGVHAQIIVLLQQILQELRELTALIASDAPQEQERSQEFQTDKGQVQEFERRTEVEKERRTEQRQPGGQDVQVNQETQTNVEQRSVIKIGPLTFKDPFAPQNDTVNETEDEAAEERNTTPDTGGDTAIIDQEANTNQEQEASAEATGENSTATTEQEANSNTEQEANATVE